MAEGWGATSVDMSAVYAAQAELARQVTDLARTVGTVAARVEDRVTHKELMATVSDFRGEYAQKHAHMEAKFDQTAKEVKETTSKEAREVKEALGSIVESLKDGLKVVAAEEVAKAMNARRQQEADALATVQKNESDLEKKVRAAQRNSVISWFIGGVAVLASIAQALGWVG